MRHALLPNRIPVLFLGAMTAFAVPLLAQPGGKPNEKSDAAEAFYRAFYLETGLRDFEQAAKAYDAIVDADSNSDAKAFLAPARVGLGRCLMALGRVEEARQSFDMALRLDPGNAEAKRALEAKPDDGMDPELKVRITALVQQLGSATRDQAMADLRKIGALKLPFLAEGLRSRDVAVVENCALLLAQDGGAGACSILASALADEDVLFPDAIGRMLENLGPTPESLDVLEVAMSSQNADIRARAAGRIRNASAKQDLDPEKVFALLSRVLADPDPRVRVRLVEFHYIDRDLVKRMTPLLVPVLRGAGSDDRKRGIKNIVQVERDGAVIPELSALGIEWLEDPEWEVRKEALEWLDEHAKRPGTAGADAMRLLVARLSDPHPQIAFAAANSIKKLGGPFDDAMRDAVLAVMERATKGELGNTSDSIFALLLEALGKAKAIRDSDSIRLWESVADRSDGGSESRISLFRSIIAPMLSGGVEDGKGQQFVRARLAATTDEADQQDALTALFRTTGNPMPADLVVTILESSHASVRTMAYDRIHQQGRPNAVELTSAAKENVAKDLLSDSSEVAKSALSLASSRPDSAFAAASKARLERASSDGQAISFYAACAGRDALPTLRAILKSSTNDFTWVTACFNLLVLDGEAANDDIVASIGGSAARVETLIGFLNDGSDVSRQNKSALAERMLTEVPLSAFSIQNLNQYTALLDRAFPPIVEKALASSDFPYRAIGCELAGRWRLEALEPKLLALLDGDVAQVEAAAQKALDAIRQKRELRNAAKLGIDFDRAKAIEESRALLKNDDPLKRRGGALALGALGDVTAVPLLLKLLDDKDAEVREAALNALSKLGEKPSKSDG